MLVNYGKGYLGYVGDVNTEEGTTELYLPCTESDWREETRNTLIV